MSEYQDFTPLYDHLLVHVPNRFDDTRTVVGPDGRVHTLHVSTDWEPEQHLASQGVVVRSPLGLREDRALAQARGGRRFTYAALRDVPTAGTTVYFDHTAMTDHREWEPGLYWVDLQQVVAVKGPEGPVPFGGYTLSEPAYEGDVHDIEGPSGLPVKARFLGELCISVNPEPLRGCGVVCFTGKPLRGQLDEVKPGDTVLFDRDVVSKVAAVDGGPWRLQPKTIRIEGWEYYAVRRDNIALVAPPGARNLGHIVRESISHGKQR